MSKWAKDMMEKRHGPRHLVVLPENVNEPWVQEAVKRGDTVTVMSIPWYVRLWWWIRRLFRGKKHGSDRQAIAAARSEDSPGLPGDGPDRPSGGEEDGGDLF